jgi:hypothetical protein
MGEKEGAVGKHGLEIDKTKILLETKREQLAKATEAFREVEETLDRQSGRWEEWQEESRGLKIRMDEEEAGLEARKGKPSFGLKDEHAELLGSALQGDPAEVEKLLEQLRKMAGSSSSAAGTGEGARRPTRTKEEEGGDGSRTRCRSRTPPGGREGEAAGGGKGTSG